MLVQWSRAIPSEAVDEPQKWHYQLRIFPESRNLLSDQHLRYFVKVVEHLVVDSLPDSRVEFLPDQLINVTREVVG